MPQWKQFSGNWTVTQAAQAKGAGTWPALPGAPTIGTATVVGTDVEVSFTAPANPGYPATLSYTVTSSPGGLTGTGSASPITVTGFSAGVEYTFTVTATNDTGTGPASAASNAVTPLVNKALYAIGGQNSSGELGQNDTVQRSSPVQIGADVDWKTISTLQAFTMSVKRDGSLWCWGSNNKGQLGQNNGTSYSSPVQVGALTNWSTVSAGKESTLAVKTDGTLWAWGDNDDGVLGNNSNHLTGGSVSSPIQIGSQTNWTYAIVGVNSSLGVRGGKIYSWGNNQNGQLGQNNVIHRSSPVQVGSLNWAEITIGTLGNGTHVLAVRTNGELYAWGLRTSGRLGDNQTTSNRSSPIQIGALTNWSLVSAGKENSHAIKTDGTLWAWGNEALGTNNTISYSSPVQVGGLTDWATVDNRMDSGTMTAVATKTDLTMWAWGKNDEGQFGLNNTFAGTYSSPVQIGVGNDWSEAQVGNNFIIALEKP